MKIVVRRENVKPSQSKPIKWFHRQAFRQSFFLFFWIHIFALSSVWNVISTVESSKQICRFRFVLNRDSKNISLNSNSTSLASFTRNLWCEMLQTKLRDDEILIFNNYGITCCLTFVCRWRFSRWDYAAGSLIEASCQAWAEYLQQLSSVLESIKKVE